MKKTENKAMQDVIVYLDFKIRESKKVGLSGKYYKDLKDKLLGKTK